MAVLEREVRRRVATMQGRLSHNTEVALRSSDYSIGAAEMALAVSSIPASRRSDWWLLALGAPIASAAVREAIRPRLLPAHVHAHASPWALLAPSLVGLAGAGVLLMTRYRATRPAPGY